MEDYGFMDNSSTYTEQLSINYSTIIPPICISGENFSLCDTNLNVLGNGTTDVELPLRMREMSSSTRTTVLIYSIIWIIASTGNLTVFASCFRTYKKNKNRITLLILHLSVGDLIVSFCLIPIEIVWRITIQWYGGNILCKLCQFMRAFGLYLSSMVLICVSFDRFFSILFPLKFAGGKQRVKVMLGCAWIASGIFSFPQVILFSVEQHPQFPSFHQCVTSEFLSTKEGGRLYSIFSVSVMYFAPLLVIIFTYSAILMKIVRKSRQQTSSENGTAMTLVSSGNVRNNKTAICQLEESCSDAETIGNQSVGQSETTAFTPSPKSKASALRFNFSQRSIERKSSSRNVRWGKVNQLEVPVEESGNLPCGSSSGLKYQIQEQRESNNGNDDTSTISLSGSNASSTNPNKGGHNALLLSRSLSTKSGTSSGMGKNQLILRMSTNATSNITRAKSRTLRLTIVIVMVFVLCWSPYVVMTLWYMFDWDTAQKVPPYIQDALFMMAVANSCVNPLVYGSFTKNCCGLTKKLNRSNTRKDGRPTTIKEALVSQASNN